MDSDTDCGVIIIVVVVIVVIHNLIRILLFFIETHPFRPIRSLNRRFQIKCASVCVSVCAEIINKNKLIA